MTPLSGSAELVERFERLIGHIETDGPQLVARRHARNLRAAIEALAALTSLQSQVEQLGREKERMREALVEARGYVDQCVITGRFATPKGLFARIDAALTSESSNATEQPAVGGD